MAIYFFWDDKNILELGSTDGCTTLQIYKKTLIVHLKGEFYNKGIIFQ